ncbi:uncharacterized protein MKZ38_000053 [Zalerion maritima]|uniref:Uncharacterized protein n=1 Tax=Zalerion maritima TaxID=339359 RepID=A0AAD5RRY7_9PEZI|nr:uncharacterized protein MKZ38_000053 [Zalerion maritima]
MHPPTHIFLLASMMVISLTLTMPIPSNAQIQLTRPQTIGERLSTTSPITFGKSNSREEEEEEEERTHPQHLQEGEPTDEQKDDESLMDQLTKIFYGGSLEDPEACFCAGGTLCCPTTGGIGGIDCNMGSC